MEYKVVTIDDKHYIECLPDGGVLQNEQDALDLVGVCGEHETHRLMLHAENLPGDFYRLSSGLAGAVLLKFSNYRIRCAAILTPELVGEGRFQEMALETDRGSEFRIYYEHTLAEQWLLSV